MKTTIIPLQRKIARIGIILALAIAGFCATAMQAQPRPAYRAPSYPRPGIVVQAPPRGFVTLNFGNNYYYMSGGAFYQRAPHGYVVVTPPAGLFLNALPPGAMRVKLNGGVYFSCNNVYFKHARGGYVVAAPPPAIVVAAPPPVLVRPPPPVVIRVAPPILPLRR